MTKWPEWLKTLWWVFITASLGYFIYKRITFFLIGTNTVTDTIVLFLLFSLILVPLFSEIELPGIKLKKELSDVKREIQDLKLQIRNSQELHSTVSPQFQIGIPPADSNLPKLEESIKAIIADTMKEYGETVKSTKKRDISVGIDVTYLFKSRYNIEIEIRRIVEPYFDSLDSIKFIPINKLLEILVTNEVIDKKFSNVIRDIYSICSMAIHGSKVSNGKLNFVKNTISDVVETLKVIQIKNSKVNNT